MAKTEGLCRVCVCVGGGGGYRLEEKLSGKSRELWAPESPGALLTCFNDGKVRVIFLGLKF